MGVRTKIQWCDDTVNITTGCDGCELWAILEELKATRSCYAGFMHEGRLAKSLPALYAPNFTEVRLAPGRMVKAAHASDLTGTDRPDKPWLNGLPRVIFVGDLGDIFSKAVPFEYLKAELTDVATSVKGRRHIYMALTKQPSRMAKFADWLKAEHGTDWPANLWAGTSITTAKTLKRLDHLCKVPAAVRFVSAEPLREAVDLRPWLPYRNDCRYFDSVDSLSTAEKDYPRRQTVQLVIVGGESDQGKHEAHRFELDWARDLIRQGQDAGIGVFVKQLGSRATDAVNGIAGATLPVHPDAAGLISRRLKDHHGGDWSEWPESLRVRQFPRDIPRGPVGAAPSLFSKEG